MRMIWCDQLNNGPWEWFFKHDGQEYGPYTTRKEAEADLRGLERFEKYKDKPGFITVDR